jgi:uncharacterized protein YpbB
MAAEDLATTAQIKRLYAVIYATNNDPKEWKKEKNVSSFERLSRAQISEYIEELEEVESELKGRNHRELSEGTQRRVTGAQVVDGDAKDEVDRAFEEQTEIDEVAEALRYCVQSARSIVEDELSQNGGLTESTRATLIEKFSVTLLRSVRQ